jgi:hypothetical protein
MHAGQRFLPEIRYDHQVTVTVIIIAVITLIHGRIGFGDDRPSLIFQDKKKRASDLYKICIDLSFVRMVNPADILGHLHGCAAGEKEYQ